jgi:hypothetical protein
MTEKDRPEFLSMLAVASETYGRELSTAAVQGYWIALCDLSLEDVQRGAYGCLRDPGRKFTPTPGEIREKAQPGSNPADQSETMWGKVFGAIGSVGRYRSVDFGDPAAHAAIRAIGGWIELCSRDTEWLCDWGRKSFCDAYRAYRKNEVDPTLSLPLAGQSELDHQKDPRVQYELKTLIQNNQRQQRSLPPPRLVPREPEMTDAQTEENRKRVSALVAKIGG